MTLQQNINLKFFCSIIDAIKVISFDLSEVKILRFLIFEHHRKLNESHQGIQNILSHLQPKFVLLILINLNRDLSFPVGFYLPVQKHLRKIWQYYI